MKDELDDKSADDDWIALTGQNDFLDVIPRAMPPGYYRKGFEPYQLARIKLFDNHRAILAEEWPML
jgi:hypothetical protein